MSPVADLENVACELATTAASTLRATLGAPGHFEAAPPGPVRDVTYPRCWRMRSVSLSVPYATS